MRKTNCVKIAKKNNSVKITRYTSKSEVRLIFYSICAVVPVFITRIEIKENMCAFSLRCFASEKGAFFALFDTKLGRI